MKMPRDHITLAALSAIAAVFFLILMNVFAKLANPFYTPVEAVFWRNIIALMFIWPLVLRKYGPRLPDMGKPVAMTIRAVLGSMTLVLTFSAYAALPMANANAITLSAPLLVGLGAALFLGEHVTMRRIICTLLGLCGTLIVLQPSAGISVYGALMAVGAATSMSAMRLLLRHLGKSEDPLAMTFYFLLIGAIFAAIPLPFVGHVPELHTVWMLVAIGLCGAFGQFFNSISYKYADASFTGMFVYTQLVWSIPFDFFIWHNNPAITTLIGAAIIIGSNLYIVLHERKRQRQVDELPTPAKDMVG